MIERNVVLTGFMGTGKTTIGRVLAERLGNEFVDTDAVIEQRYGPIPTIFAEHGEGMFRRYERDLAEELADRRGVVIATGGRMMVDAVNAQRLVATGDVYCLSATIDTILERVATGDATSSRPMLAGDDVRERVVRLLAEREAAYGAFPTIITDGREPTEIADEIVELLQS